MATIRKKRTNKAEERCTLAYSFVRKDDIQLEDLNKGELLAICSHIGEPAFRGLSKTDLVQITEGRRIKPVIPPLDRLRDKLIAFIQLYWDSIKYQLPAGCTGMCYQCSDMKMLVCYTENREHLFKSRR